jgi:hypothetical protein
MSKIGINISIDVSKIDKARLFKGKKGTYMDLTTFIDPEKPDQYDQHGFICQSTSKDEREKDVKTPILGNCTVFFTEGSSAATTVGDAPALGNAAFDDDIPF